MSLTAYHAKLFAHELTKLSDKFFLPTAMLEAKTFHEAIRGGN